eukprot:11207445-Lingulodinium_polyedra.AAC.1
MRGGTRQRKPTSLRLCAAQVNARAYRRVAHATINDAREPMVTEPRVLANFPEPASLGLRP